MINKNGREVWSVGEFDGYRERAKLDNLLRHLLWNDDPRDAAIDDFEKMLEDSFETFYGRLAEISPKLRREHDRLFEAVTDFAGVQDSVYFKLGVLTGFRLYRDLDAAYEHEVLRAKTRYADLKTQWGDY